MSNLEVIEAELARAPLEFRAATTLDVRFPDRIIELLAMPYEQDTVVVHMGQPVVESFGRTAFLGVEKRANRIKVNRDHDLDRTCGRAVALHPTADNGLIAELRISRTPLGEETLELAADGVLDASVGWAPMPGGETWSEMGKRRHVERAYLGHIALVPDPAYQGATVLDVRRRDVQLQGSATPNLDVVLARLRELGYSPAPK